MKCNPEDEKDRHRSSFLATGRRCSHRPPPFNRTWSTAARLIAAEAEPALWSARSS
ncbi:hypothetical protein [Methanosphaerula palustris]|uniref:hypothetical protein n=1 Tax=Methanosphaerula palustris TaxID=475088 RepID=UPI0013053E8A|nr:hypothetical protein [Methanosphaerula palustris]